ncbi:uncharacterized protein ACIGJ3_017179 [Trichechus inunguis]
MYLENGTLIENGSCVALGECREGVYALSYGPNSSFWISSACCENLCSRIFHREMESEAQPNAVQCHYCSGDKSAPCDSLSVMNCTGNQTACVTISGTWSGGGPQILKGCATSEVCQLPANATLGPEESGFHLTAVPECNFRPLPTQRGPQANTTHKAKVTVCFTCSDLDHCDPLPCLEDRNYCLQATVIRALGDGNSVAWRNGSCVASNNCKLNNSISALTYNAGFGFWVNATCCQGNCQEPTPFALPALHTASQFLCPTCSGDPPGPCNASFYMQCPSGETECVQLDLTSEADGRNVSVRGCGSRHLCDALPGSEGLLALAGYRLADRPDCSSSQRAILVSKCLSGVAPGLRLALPVLVVALGTATFS